jgi:hypothetical protein
MGEDFARPADPPAPLDPLPVDEDPSRLVDPAGPVHDEPGVLLDATPGVEASELAASSYADTPAYDALAAESSFGLTEPARPTGAAGVLAKVKTLADERPAAFLVAALLAGWLVGKLLGSSDDDEE